LATCLIPDRRSGSRFAAALQAPWGPYGLLGRLGVPVAPLPPLAPLAAAADLRASIGPRGVVVNHFRYGELQLE
jgi:hypothetical protein